VKLLFSINNSKNLTSSETDSAFRFVVHSAQRRLHSCPLFLCCRDELSN